MVSVALMLNRVTLVSLTGDDHPAILPPLLRTPACLEAEAIPVRSDTMAQRTLLAARIDNAIARADRAVMLVAQGTGCMAAAWWGRLSPRSYVDRVAGALMVAPREYRGRTPPFASPPTALPFPSLVLGADDAAQRLAGQWGSRLIDGPLTIEQQRPSRRLQAIVARFTAAIVERDVRTAQRLLAAIGDG